MFLKPSIFKRMIKEAYNAAGLTVANDGDGIILADNCWIIWMKSVNIPKKLKAAVIELTGDLPEAGEVFKAQKGIGNQSEIPREELLNLRRGAKSGETLKETDITIGKLRLFQKENGAIQAYNSEKVDVVSWDDMDAGEIAPGDPEEHGMGARWENDRGIYVLIRNNVEDENLEKVIYKLQEIKLVK